VPSPKKSTAHVPTEETRFQAWIGSAAGYKPARIAAILNITPGVLKRHYSHELDCAREEANINVVANLYREATGTGPNAVRAAIFWLEMRAGWSEAAAGGDGSQLPPVIAINFVNMLPKTNDSNSTRNGEDNSSTPPSTEPEPGG
jgi:hypothetical protein